MVLTPTYHVFDLYKEHQDADAVYCYNDTVCEYEKVPMVTSSASVKENKMTLTLTNSSLTDSATIACTTAGFAGKTASAVIYVHLTKFKASHLCAGGLPDGRTKGGICNKAEMRVAQRAVSGKGKI